MSRNYKYPFKIGGKYKYTNNKVFILQKVKKDKFLFVCGHWCFGSCFQDLIDLEDGKQIFEKTENYTQLNLF